MFNCKLKPKFTYLVKKTVKYNIAGIAKPQQKFDNKVNKVYLSMINIISYKIATHIVYNKTLSSISYSV